MIVATKPIFHLRILNFSTNTTLSEYELKRRLETFQDLYVVARDCIEDLINSQDDTEIDDDNDNNPEADDNFFQQLAFVKESVDAAKKEFNTILDDLNDDEEQKNRIMKSHGNKVKRLELEMAMLLQDTNLNDDDDDDDNNNTDDDIDNDNIEIEDDSEEDDDDDDDDDEEEEEEEENVKPNHDDRRK